MKPTIKSSRLRSLAIRLGLILLALFVQQSVRADIQTWWGNGASIFWSDSSGNWTNSELAASIPANGDALVFPNSTATSSSNDLSGLSVSSVTFQTGDFHFYGNLLTITGGITNTTGDNIFDLPLTLNGAQTFEVDGSSLTLNQGITNGGNTLTFAGVGNANLNGSVSGAGSLIMAGTGTLQVTNRQPLTGGIVVNSGTLQVLTAGNLDFGGALTPSLITVNTNGTIYGMTTHAIGGGTSVFINRGIWKLDAEDYKQNITMWDGTIEPGPSPNSSGGQLRVGYAGGAGSYTWYVTNSLNGSGSLISSPLSTIGSTVNLTLDVARGAAASDLTISGGILGAGNITVARNGITTISGNNTQTGAFTIAGGTVVLTGSLLSSVITVATNTWFDISSASYSLNTNQMLTGVGTVLGTLNDQTPEVTGAVVSPAGNGAAGTLVMSGLNLSGNGLALNFDLAKTTGIGGGTNDLLIVTNLTLSGNGNTGSPTNIVNINFLNSTPLVGGTYTLILYTNGNGLAAGPVYTLAAAASRYNYSFFSDGASIKVTVTGSPGNLVWKGDGITNSWDVNITTNWLLGGSPSVYLAGDNTTFSDVGSNNLPVNVTAALSPTILTVSNYVKDYTLAGAGKITGGSSLVKTGSGNLTLLTANDFTGPSSINGSGVVNVGNGGGTGNLGAGYLTNNSKVTFFETASTTYSGSMSGTGSLVSFMPGATLTLTGTNTFTGGLLALGGTTQIGNNTAGASPSVAGTITNYSTVNIYRSDAFTNKNNITDAGNTLEYGPGDVNVRGVGGMTVDGNGSINLLPQGSLSIGQSASGLMTVNPGAVINIGLNFLLGNPSGSANYGVVVQNGGTINVGNNLRIGHWASEVSFYTMNGGTLNVPNNDLAVGWDGIGLMTMTGGTVNCRTLNVDDNGFTGGYSATSTTLLTNSIFTMTGGQLNIGTGGISGSAQTNATILLSGGTIGTLVPSTLIAAGWSSSMNLRLTNGSPTFDSSNSIITLSGGLSGNGGLIKQGVGFLNLNNATNSYTNVTIVAAGTLQGSGTVVGPITVNSGASISAGATLATGTLTTSNLTVSAGGNVVIDASSTAATSDLLYVKGALTLNSTPLTFNFLGGTPYTGGAYTIISNLVSPRTGTLVYNNPTRYAATLDQTQPNRIQVTFSGANASLVWQGTASPNWNATDNNWLNNGVLDKYYQSDAVLFDNSGITQPNVNLSATMAPASVTVDSTGNYTFSGSPISGVAALTKSGSGMLTLVNSNNYTGVTTIAGGTLQVGNGGTSGFLPTGTVDDYGSLVFNRSDTVTYNGTVNGPGSLTQAGSGTLLITATQNHYGGTTVNPGGTIQLGNGAQADAGSLGNGPVTNNGTINFYRLSSIAVAAPYTGAGNFNFLGTGISGQSGYSLNATNTFTGPVTLSLARIQSGSGAYSFGSPSSITVNPGSQVYAVAVPYSSVYNMPLSLAGSGWQDGLGALRIESGGTWAGNLTLAANARIGVNNASTNTITGSIGGNYELETYGGNAGASLILSPASANTFNALRVSIGTAGSKTIAGNANAIPNNIPLTMNGGTLWLNGFSRSFTNFLSLNSSSSIQNGSATSPANLTLTPPVNVASTIGTFADGSVMPLNVTVNQRGPTASFAVSSSSSWTGNFTNNNGTVNITAAGQLGSSTVASRTLVFNNTTLNISPNNGWSGSGAAATMVFNNSTVVNTRYNSFGPLVLNGSTLTGTDANDSSYWLYSLYGGSVTVTGSAPSYMLGSGAGYGYGLQTPTVFNVAHTGSASPDLTVSAPLRSGGTPIAGTGAVTKTGAGTMLVDAVATYTGPTLINNGVLALSANGSIATSPTITVAGGATFDVSAVSGGSLTLGAQTLSGGGSVNGSLADATGSVIQPGGSSSAGTLTITTNLTLNGLGSLGFALAGATTVGGNVNGLLKVNGNLTLSSSTPTPVNFNFLNGAPVLGTPYTIIQCGSLTGTAATALTNSSRYAAVFSQTPTAIQVTFSGAASNLVWTGTDPLTPSTWDVATSTNWFDGASGNVFYQLDGVRFDNTSANNTVNLGLTVMPASVTVDSTNNYTITGSGAIGGSTGLTKNNTNTLTLSTANTFSGPVTVNGGVLMLGNGSAIPQNASITVTNGAQFDFAGNGNSTTHNYSFAIGGSGPTGNGALVNSGAAVYGSASVASLTLSANATIGDVNGRWDVGSGQTGTVLNGNGYNLTVNNTSAGMSMRPQLITNVASITLTNGLMWYEAFNQTNSWTATTTNYILAGCVLGNYGGQAVSLPIVLTNATIQNQGSGTPNWLSQITLLGTNVFNNSGAQVFAGVISGPGAIDIGGASTTAGAIPPTLTFSNASTFTGGVTISNAPVTKNNATAVSGFAALVLTSSNALGTGPITFDLSLMTTNAMTNVARVLECNITGGGVIPNNIILPTPGTVGLGVTNVGIQGRDSSSVFTLSGQISGGVAGLTNWVDFGDASSSGVMRLANGGNTFMGTIYCDRGVLAITGDGCLGNAANPLFLNQGSANGGLRFDAPNINVAHSIIWNTASTISVYGDNDGDGVPEVANNATISGNISSIATGQGLNIGGGTNIAGTCYGSLTLSGSNTFNNQITINANTKLIAASTNALGGTGYYGIVSQGGTLSLANVGAFVNRQIQFSGPGVVSGGVGVGALENLAGTNVYSASLSLNAASSFGVTAGSLNLTAGISGAYPLTKVGPGPLILSATETYGAGTFVNAGTLVVNGSLPVGNAVSVASGATLGGSGTINGPITTQAGAVLMPGGGLVPGKLIVNNALNLAGNTIMYLNNSATPATNSQIAGLSVVYYGGALSVTNLGNPASLTNGCRFTLFSATDHQGSFAVTNLPALNNGLGWSNSLAIDGSIEVVAVNTENPLPGPIVANISGTNLTLSWPTNSGWTLQQQTNSLATGLSTNWVDVPGSSSVTSTNVPIDATKPTVFYRLRY